MSFDRSVTFKREVVAKLEENLRIQPKAPAVYFLQHF